MLEDHAALMREQELKRRAGRREYLRKCLANEALLADEHLTDADLRAHEAAVRSLRRQELAFEKMVHPGYFQRLWAALWGR